MRSVRAAVAVGATLGLLCTAGVAGASVGETELGIDIEQVDAAPDGTTTVTLNVAGIAPGEGLDPSLLEVVENGVTVEELVVGPIEDVGQEAQPAAVVLAIDTSGSTEEGGAIDAAKAAASALAREITEDGGLVGLVQFNEDVTTVSGLTTEGEVVASAIDQFRPAFATALYDGISRAVRIAAGHDGPRDVIVFSDGDDTTSSSSLDDVLSLTASTGVPVTVVRLGIEADDDLAALDAIADASDGAVIRVAEVSELAGAFKAIAADLRNRIQLSWMSEPAEERSDFLNIVATYRGETPVSDGVVVPNPRLVKITPPQEVDVRGPLIPALATGTGLAVGVGALALSVFLISIVLFAAASQRRRESSIDRRLSVYESEEEERGPIDIRTASRSLSSRAADVVDAIPRPTTVDARLAAKIEQADWPMRVGEFLLVVLATVLGITVLVLLISNAPWWLATFAGLLGFVAPFLILQLAVSRRQRAFADQLPDVLQVIGGALRAGHAFSTAVEGAVAEVREPASTELRRASVEARLGRPMDKALLGVADRMDSVDLTWVVSALAVQREVGGNLAEVLSNVASTLRARASVRRQVQALSAEGRLSANIISAMPFVMFLVLTVISPDYIAILFQRRIGIAIIIAGLVLLTLGIIWLRRLVRPQF